MVEVLVRWLRVRLLERDPLRALRLVLERRGLEVPEGRLSVLRLHLLLRDQGRPPMLAIMRRARGVEGLLLGVSQGASQS